MNDPTRVRLVAIVGGSGAGKTWLAQRLCHLLGDLAGHLQLDAFYRDRSHLSPARRARINFDVPHAIDWLWAGRVLRGCRLGAAATVPRYDFASYARLAPAIAWAPRPIVFVDGLWLLRRPAVRQLFDLKIFIDVPQSVRRERRLARDVVERGYDSGDVDRRFHAAVAPMHDRYVEPQKRHADLVLAHPFREADIRALSDRVWSVLHEGGLVAPWLHETFRAELAATLAGGAPRRFAAPPARDEAHAASPAPAVAAAASLSA